MKTRQITAILLAIAGIAITVLTTHYFEQKRIQRMHVNLPWREAFRMSANGQACDLFYLRNRNGMQAAITNYGGRIVGLWVPDKNDSLVDVVVGFDSVQQYAESREPYFGATIGRYGNRIAKGIFRLEGKTYHLSVNNGPNTLHGGREGFQNQVWQARQLGDSSLLLSYLSKDGSNGFPGNLQVSVTYTLSPNNALEISYRATTDYTTVVNLTNHAFFNLNGAGSGTVLHHLLQINAGRFTPVDSTLIPTGLIAPVAGTPFDFRRPVPIGRHIHDLNVQLTNGRGYDHNFVLNGSGWKTAAAVTGDLSGIHMEVLTDQPGLQFYSGNFMQGLNRIRGGKRDEHRTAFCLETQHFPDAPNHPNFPSTVLRPGEVYRSRSLYQFSVQ